MMMQQRTLKGLILSGVDSLIEMNEHDVNSFKYRDTALDEYDIRNLREILDKQHKLLVFRNAFAAGVEVGLGAYDQQMLAEIVSYIIGNEER